MTEEYITQVSKEIEGRLTKKLSQDFGRTESRILFALSKFDEFLLIPQAQTCSLAVPETFRNNDSKFRERTGDHALNDPYTEVEFSACRTKLFWWNYIFWNYSTFFFEILFWNIERTMQMTEQEDNFNLGKSLWRQQSREKVVGLFGTNLFQIMICLLVPTFCDFVDYLWLLLENSSLKNLGRINNDTYNNNFL